MGSLKSWSAWASTAHGRKEVAQELSFLNLTALWMWLVNSFANKFYFCFSLKTKGYGSNPKLAKVSGKIFDIRGCQTESYMARVRLAPCKPLICSSVRIHVCKMRVSLVQLCESSKGAMHSVQRIQSHLCLYTAYFPASAICNAAPLQRRQCQLCQVPL